MKEAKNSSTYPDIFYRGIPNNTYKDGILMQDSFRLDPVREDGFCEISITWRDAPEALDIIMSQISERTGDYQFRDGIAEVDRREMDQRMKPQMIQGNLAYERRPTDNNQFHGNILVKGSLEKGMKNLIIAQLALLANGCIHPNRFVC